MAASFFPSPPLIPISVSLPSPHGNGCLPPSPTLVSARLHFQSAVTAGLRRDVSLATAAGANPDAVSVPKSVPVRVAHELLQAGHRYLDVRTEEEFSTGHAVGAINVPYMLRVGSGMTKNPNFFEEVLSHFGKDDEIIVGCQSGKRSLMAATELSSAGFTGITDIAGGYSSWMQNELPTE